MSGTRGDDQKAVWLDDVLTKEIVKRILSVSRPDRVIVFGSPATWGMNADSDIDLDIRRDFARQWPRKIFQLGGRGSGVVVANWNLTPGPCPVSCNRRGEAGPLVF